MTVRLKYVGGLDTCGMLALESGHAYYVKRGQVFSVSEDDAESLLRRYSEHLEIVKRPEKRKAKADAGGSAMANQESGATGDGS